MSGAEHQEPGHEPGGNTDHVKARGRLIGLSMALLGVMLAFCAAMVGSERTDLIKATVDQSNKLGVFQAKSTKYRVMQADLEMLHALTPSKAETKKFEANLAAVKRVGGKADDEDTAELKEGIHVATTEIADLLTPDAEDEQRISGLAAKYARERAEAKEDADAYDGRIEAHHRAAEGFERAQLCAEVGIVIASIALLLSSRAIWAVALIFGIAGAGFVGTTVTGTRAALADADRKIAEAAKNAAAIRESD